MKIVSFKICPFVQRVVAMLEAKGIAYEVEYISLKDKPQWFLNVSPNGQVPVLITNNGQALFESEAIVEYLDEVYPSQDVEVPATTKAARRAWSYLGAKNYLTQCSAMRSSDADALRSRADKLGTAFDKVEGALGEASFFDDDTPGRVDIAWLPLLHRAAIIERETGYDLIGDRPKVKRWQANLLATGLPERSVAADFHEAFTGFYLSDRTFLGSGGRVSTGAFADGTTMAEIEA